MKIYPKSKYWLLALSILIGLGLALALPAMAGAQWTPETVTNGATTYHVAKSGDGADGLSWTSAFTEVQDALAVAASGDQIWVATGVYTPGIAQSDRFNLVPGAALYGGFDPAGGADQFGERDWLAYPTVLSGDIAGDDHTDPNGVVTSTANINGPNSSHVVWADGTSTPITETTLLDGFTITAGQDGDDAGGGFYCSGYGSGAECSPSLINVIFSGNTALEWGGAMYNDGKNGGASSPSLTNVVFSGNSAGWGGAMFNNGYNGASSPRLINVTFAGNLAAGLYSQGGAMYNNGEGSGDSSPSLINVVFSGNSAGFSGGAMFNIGYNGASSPSLINVTFSGNSANDGGAMFNVSDEGDSSPSLINVTFSGNSASNGGAMFNASSPSLTNVILWGNTAIVSGTQMYNTNATPVITTSLVQGGIAGTGIYNDNSTVTDGGGNIDDDPLFVRDPDPGDSDWSTLGDNDYGDLRLSPGSPAIDVGTNSAIPAGVTTDLDGNLRIINGIVDMGAFEAWLWLWLPLVLK